MEFLGVLSIWAIAMLLLILFVVKNGLKNRPIYRVLVCGPKEKYTYIVQRKRIFFWKNEKCVIQSVLVDAHFDNIDSVKSFIEEQQRSEKEIIEKRKLEKLKNKKI